MKCDFTLRLPLQGVAAWRPGVGRLPQHQGRVVVDLGHLGGPWPLGDTFRREIGKEKKKTSMQGNEVQNCIRKLRWCLFLEVFQGERVGEAHFH